MTSNQIRGLEKKYFNIIVGILSNPVSEVKKNLLEIEQITRSKYVNLHLLWGKKNKIDIAVERLLRYHLYTKVSPVGVYASPLSPDVAIELQDVILCLDAKTIDLDGNPGDDKYLNFGKNQITFDNIALKKSISQINSKWQGLSFPPQLEEFDQNGKPCLTFFVNFCYEDDKSTFKFSHLTISCIPHAKVIKEKKYHNNIIQNYKSWDYIKKGQFTNLKLNPIINSKAPLQNWIPVEFEFDENNNKIVTSYIDPSISHPLTGGLCLRKMPKKSDKMWKVALWGNSARIYKTTIKNRTDEKGQPWIGIKEFKIGYGYPLNKKTKKFLSSFDDGCKVIDRYAEINLLKQLQGVN